MNSTQENRAQVQRELVAVAFGQALAHVRHDAKHKQRTLASMAGISHSYLSMLERGLRTPSLAHVFALAAALGVEPEIVVKHTRIVMERLQAGKKLD